MAVGDVNGDGIYDILVGQASGSSEVKVIDGTKLGQVDPVTGEILPSALLADFLAFDPSFQGGVFVAAGDINSDGLDDVIAGMGPGAPPIIKVVDATKLNQVGANFEISDSALVSSFLAFEASFAGGVRVAAGDIAGDGRIAIVAARGPGSTPQVKVFADMGQVEAASFLAYESTFTGGVYVGTGNLKGFAFDDIVTGKGAGSVPLVKVFTNQSSMDMGGLNLTQLDSFFAYDPSFQGGVRVTSLHDLIPLPNYGGNRDDVVTTQNTGTGTQPSIFSLSNPASTPAYVNGLYKDVLLRANPPSPAEADGWIQLLDTGLATRAQVALLFQTSAEGAGVVVDQFYQHLLGRPADPQGRAHWVSVLVGGVSRSVVEASFLSSTEYVTNHGPGDTAYVQAVYQTVLSRPADPAGLQFWVGALASGLSKAEFATTFLNTQESRTQVVQSYYQIFLHRVADSGGLTYWLTTLEQGGTWEQVESGILASAEYGARVSEP